MSEIVNNNNSGNGIVTKILVGGALVAAFGGWYYQSTQVNDMRHELAGTQQKMEQLRGQMDTSVAMAKAEVNDTVAKMNEEVEKAQKTSAAQVARVQASSKKETSAVMTTLSAKNAELAGQIDQYKKDVEDKSTKFDTAINAVQTDVGNVRTEVATTKSDLEKTVADLKRMNGDMGVMSGLIATNGSELEALKKLGEKDYFEFTLAKSATAQKVGGIQLALKKADMKRNKFTMDVLADDRKVEKKDKGVNEPVQFYTSGSRLPFELVVNQVSKDKVTGYLAVPKVKVIAQR